MTSWIGHARKALDEVEATQSKAIDAASAIAAASIADGGVVYLFGSGHSRMIVEELFPRYGSFSGFQPIVELSMTFHNQVVGANGQRQAMFIERVEGLADQILANFQIRPPHSMIVFSVSGRNAVPIEMAIGAKRHGIPVIAVTSLQDTHAAPARHSSGTRLLDHADVTIDLCSPPGDAVCDVAGLGERVGPISTLTGVAIANEIKVRTAGLLTARGFAPPVITSANVVGDARSKELFEGAYHDFARRYAHSLAID